MNRRIMIVDDEQAIRDSLQGLFEDEDYLVTCAASGEEAVARFRKSPVDCVLLDIWMPGIDGLETLARLRNIDSSVPVVMMSGHATIDTAVRATRQGAFDFVEKPLSSDRLLILARNAMEKRKLARENFELKQTAEQQSRCELIGQSKAIHDVREMIKRVAVTDAPVLILGEHGTDKAVAARLLHQYSTRSEKAFVAANTAGINDTRMDSELFGHEKGAFPGALDTRRGRFEMANGGSLFFDELTDLSMAAQAKVLRVLHDRAVQRVGGSTFLSINVRLIAASSHDLEQALRDGAVREDFYYFLNVVNIRMPALRERIEDIPLLVEILTDEQAAELGGEPVRFTPDAMTMLQSYPWTGNVRELRNYIERCHILKPGESIAAIDMPPLNQEDMRADAGADSFRSAREAFERSYLLFHLNRNNWNVSRTAEDIGMERSQLHRKIKSFDLNEFRENDT